jgi:M-phase inducer phosphatase
MTKQCDKVDKQEFHRNMTENNEIAANMYFEEKNQEQKSALIMKINKEISETSEYPVESPMSNLAFRLGISKIATPRLQKPPEMCGTNSNDDNTALKNMFNDKLIDKNDLISKIVTSVENSPITRNLSRRLLISPQNINFDLKSDLQNDEDDEDDMSFYPLNRPFYGVQLNGENISLEDEHDKIREQETAPILTLVEPNSPKKSDLSSESAHRTPSKYTVMSTGSSRLGNGFKVYDSISSGSNESNEMEDEYLELMEMENLDDETQMPSDLSSLLCKDVKHSKSPEGKKCSDMDKSTEHGSFVRPKLNRVTSLFAAPDRQCLATINENVTSFGSNRCTTAGAFKRPEPPIVAIPSQSKRHKGEQDDLISSIIIPLQMKRPPLRKTVSMNDAATIMDALTRSSEDTDLIGDFSKKFCLPFIDGRHKDLRSISVDTMRSLLMGEFDDCVSSFKIIDCRYPYEYEGGHIHGAINLYTQDQIIEELVNKKAPEVPNVNGRNILIFHCEFSSERGPKLSRFLRNHDRMSSSYPALQYPEVYLLHGGYKEFFQNNSDLCDPQSYRPMLDTNYSNEYKHFRAKSKSWTGDGRSSNRLSKSRSRLVL